MAFPTVNDADTTTFTQSAANSSSWAITYPANISAGDLLLAFISSDGNPTFSWAGSAFTAIKQLAAGGSAAKLGVYARIATGSESGTVTLTLGTAERGVVKVFRISASTWRNSGTVTNDVESSTGASGTATSADPDALNPANWDVEDTLWFAAVAADDQNTVTFNYPSSYTNTSYNDAGATNGSYLGLGRRENATASEDPSAFSWTNSTEYAVATIGIRPAAAAGAVKPKTLLTLGVG